VNVYKIGDRVQCQEADLDEIGDVVMPAGVYKIIGIQQPKPYTVQWENGPIETHMSLIMYEVEGADGEQYAIQSTVITGVAND
jgi:hypothetical protein